MTSAAADRSWNFKNDKNTIPIWRFRAPKMRSVGDRQKRQKLHQKMPFQADRLDRPVLTDQKNTPKHYQEMIFQRFFCHSVNAPVFYVCHSINTQVKLGQGSCIVGWGLWDVGYGLGVMCWEYALGWLRANLTLELVFTYNLFQLWIQLSCTLSFFSM